MRVVIYLRISHDPDGTQKATQRQREDCEAWAQRNGATVIGIFEDVDLSAFNRKVTRPRFEAMLRSVQARQVDGIVAWKLDRLSRRMRDFARLDEACEAAGAFIVTIADAVDTRTPLGRTVAELFTSLARMESENFSIRMARAMQAKAEAGIAHAGGRRRFGYTKGEHREVVPEEAAAIRGAVEQILFAGASVAAIARDWHARGITSPTGAAWRSHHIARMLRAGHLAGLRVYHGRELPGGWEPIISTDELAAVRAALRRPANVRQAGVRLLTGILHCSRCGHGMIASAQARGTRKFRIYACQARTGTSRCGSTVCVAESAERFVRDIIAAALDSGAIAAARASRGEPDRQAIIQAIATDEASLDQLSTDYYVDKLITRPEYFAARDALGRKLDSSRAALAQIVAPAGPLPDAGTQFITLWEAAGTEQRRALLTAFVSRIDLLPATRKGKADPTRFAPVWRV